MFNKTANVACATAASLMLATTAHAGLLKSVTDAVKDTVQVEASVSDGISAGAKLNVGGTSASASLSLSGSSADANLSVGSTTNSSDPTSGGSAGSGGTGGTGGSGGNHANNPAGGTNRVASASSFSEISAEQKAALVGKILVSREEAVLGMIEDVRLSSEGRQVLWVDLNPALHLSFQNAWVSVSNAQVHGDIVKMRMNQRTFVNMFNNMQ